MVIREANRGIRVQVIWQSVPYQRRAIHAGQCGVEVEEEQSRQVTGSLTSKSSRLEAFVER